MLLSADRTNLNFIINCVFHVPDAYLYLSYYVSVAKFFLGILLFVTFNPSHSFISHIYLEWCITCGCDIVLKRFRCTSMYWYRGGWKSDCKSESRSRSGIGVGIGVGIDADGVVNIFLDAV